jgi:hypothetical protein
MATSRSETLDTHWSSTRRTADPKVYDQYFQKVPTVNEFRKSAMQMVDGGGRGIEVRVQTSGNTQAGSFKGYDPLPKSPINPVETAEFNRRYYMCPIILADTDKWENSSAEKVFDELKNLGDIAMEAILQAINEDFYTAQTGKNILGFPDTIADAGGATVGGILSVTDGKWDNNRSTSATTFLTVSNSVVAGIDLWGDMLDECHIDKGNPTKLFTTWSIARAYRVALSSQGYARTTVENTGGFGGELHPPFYSCKLIADNDCTALHSYFVDTASEKLRVMRQVNFTKTPFVTLQSNGQLAQLSYLVAGVTHTTNSRRSNAVTTALTGT